MSSSSAVLPVVFVAIVAGGIFSAFRNISLPHDAQYVYHLFRLPSQLHGEEWRVWRARLVEGGRYPVKPAEREGDELEQYEDLVPSPSGGAGAGAPPGAGAGASPSPLFFVVEKVQHKVESPGSYASEVARECAVASVPMFISTFPPFLCTSFAGAGGSGSVTAGVSGHATMANTVSGGSSLSVVFGALGSGAGGRVSAGGAPLSAEKATHEVEEKARLAAIERAKGAA